MNFLAALPSVRSLKSSSSISFSACGVTISLTLLSTMKWWSRCLPEPTSFAATLWQMTVGCSLPHMYRGPTIAHPANVLIANGPPSSLANTTTGSRAFGQFQPIRRPILASGNCGGKSLAMFLRCFHRWAGSGVGTFLGRERSSLVNIFGSWIGWSPFKSVTTNPFKTLESCNFVPLSVFTISCVFTPFTFKTAAISSRMNEPVLQVSSMA